MISRPPCLFRATMVTMLMISVIASLSDPSTASDIRPGTDRPIGTCDLIVVEAEERHGIPRNLLRAMAHVETGTTIGEVAVTWPWSANIAGASYRFWTEQEMADAAREAVLRGDQVDVGCMQINISHAHPVAELNGGPKSTFDRLSEVTDPVRNVEYAARYLIRLYRREGDWTNAVARYHSANTELRIRYVCRVLKRHGKLEDREADAHHELCDAEDRKRVPPRGEAA